MTSLPALPRPDELPGPQYRLVVANILLNTLVELAPAIARKVAPGGRLVLSGLLPAQADEAQRAYVAQGLVAGPRKEREGWIRVELSRACSDSHDRRASNGVAPAQTAGD